MNTPPRPFPRFLPTLTQVVKPSELSAEAGPAQPEYELLKQTLMLQVEALVKARVQQELSKLIHTVVAERADAMIDRLKTDLQLEIEKMVDDAVGDRNKSNKFNS